MAEAVRERLQAALSPVPLLETVGPKQGYPYSWMPGRVATARGRYGEHVSTFSVYHRAPGKDAAEKQAQKADFLDGLAIAEFGDAAALRYSLASRIGPETDPDDGKTELVTDTYSCVYVSKRSPAATA